MARNDIDSFIRKLRRGVGKTFTKKTMKQFGELAIEAIVKRTRRGLGVDRAGGKENRLKPLSPNYIEYRKRNRSKLDRTTSPRKSNLTFTGQLLRSMRVKEVSNRRVRWGPNRRRRKGGITNEELGEILSEKRPFNNLSRNDIKKIAKKVDKVLQRNTRRL